MRFVFLTQYFPPEIGAPQVRLAAMTRELVRLGHEVEVVTAMPNHPEGRIFRDYRGSLYRRERSNGMTLHRVWLYASTGSGLRRMLNYASFTVTSLWGLFKAKKPDFLFVESPPLFLSFPAALAARIWKRPIIFNVADIWPDAAEQLGVLTNRRLIRVLEWLEGWSYATAKYVTTVTDVFAETLRSKKGVKPDKLLSLPNGVDTELFRRLPPDRALAESLGVSDKKVLLYAGTHGYAHAVEMALEAAGFLQERDAGIHLLFVGDGSEKARLMAMARTMALENVTFHAPVPPEDIARLYSISVGALSTLRSTYNTRPVKILAAMACEKPIAYCGGGEGARLVEEARAGVITPANEPEALADAIYSLANQPELAAQFGSNGRRYVCETMSWKKLVEDWLQRLEPNAQSPHEQLAHAPE